LLLPRSRREAYIQRQRSGGQQNDTSTNYLSVPLLHILAEDIDVRGLPPPYQPRANHLLMRRPPPPYHSRAIDDYWIRGPPPPYRSRHSKSF
jgi:hypothetical protein